MKYKGFTLAEVLITLGIIGVVAALTAPALYQDVSNAHIGPTLSKFKSTLENANYQMLNDAGASDLRELFGNDVIAATSGNATRNNANGRKLSDELYFERLTEYIHGSSVIAPNTPEAALIPSAGQLDRNSRNGSNWAWMATLTMMNNVNVKISDINWNHQPYITNDSNLRGFFADIIVDINGIQRGPNIRGMDLFDFSIDRNGTVIPAGSTRFASRVDKDGNVFLNNNHWRRNGWYRCDENPSSGGGCAGSIFENKLKVIYK